MLRKPSGRDLEIMARLFMTSADDLSLVGGNSHLQIGQKGWILLEFI